MPVVEPKNQSVKSLQGLHVYHAGISNCSMRVRLALEEKGLDWHSHRLNLLKKEHITEEYFGINPKGLVPTLVHDGIVIVESDDIIEYIDETFPEPRLRPAEESARQAVEVWLHRATSIHVSAVKTYIYEKRIGGKMAQSGAEQSRYESLQKDKELLEFHRKSSGGGFSQEELDAAKATLDNCFADIEKALAGQDWLVGDAFTLADIAWIPLQITLAVLADYSFDGLTNVESWSQRIAARPSYQRAVLDWWPAEMPLPAWQQA